MITSAKNNGEGGVRTLLQQPANITESKIRYLVQLRKTKMKLGTRETKAYINAYVPLVPFIFVFNLLFYAVTDLDQKMV